MRVTVTGGEPGMTLRWESQGSVAGVGPEVLWPPASEEDALTLAVRGRGGLAFASLRARDLLPNGA